MLKQFIEEHKIKSIVCCFSGGKDSFKKKGSAFYIGKKIYAKDLLKQKTIEEYSRG